MGRSGRQRAVLRALPGSAIAVGRVHAVGHVYEARIPGVPANIADVLFKSPANGGLGLNKLQFYSPRNGFRYLPPDPTPNGTANWFYYSMFHQPLNCVDVVDPPGNSG